ncbi:phosphoribosylanthranilate isomerase [Inmirania thermothiophila]|uniref:N-(5'-phosphoribosyl)anthranilate isomerase n=1 Tax=Inmirania thermothiophila TaxID=1750597 RepID=A0A3N1Y1Y0_9GAMM|nr:phosphoribosylanthranilate isomerase [Inmirania thermothiophila]ROR32835.1 phosphoribosylanthranilate isomerase [Inmirania thermothiophila]
MPTRTRVKICGLRRPADAVAAAAAGADAIGLVFYGPSPRAVDLGQALAVAAAVPPFVARVALFVDPDPELVRGVLATVPVELLQFHGEEPPAFCRSFGRPYIKAVRLREAGDWARAEARWGDAAALLADTDRPGRPGGTGETFDWSLVPAHRRLPLILAGGLRPDNVGAAVRAVRPYAVDVSGGVERAPGEKDPARMEAFLGEVRDADAA